jgi:hypothetical protein
MNKIFDLRFVIGLFFTVIGALLVIYGFAGAAKALINKWSGGIFLIFGIIMIIFSKKRTPENTSEN